MSNPLHLIAGVEAPMLSRGVVSAVLVDAVIVSTANRGPTACDVLANCEADQLADGDHVLVWMPADASERGVVIGQLKRPPLCNTAEKDELVIESKKQLTLKCGEGSITLCEDGKILIKGKDLVSHARRLNRIRGGSVEIN